MSSGILWRLALQVGWTAAVFIVDLQLPLGWSIWVLYFILLPVVWQGTRAQIVTWPSLWSVLIVLDFFLSPPGGDWRAGLSNRTIAMTFLWILTGSILSRQRMQTRLRDSEEKLRLFIEHAPAALAMFDRQMRCLAVSRRWITDFQLAVDDVIGRSHYDVFPEIPESWKAMHRRAMSGEVVLPYEDRFARSNGTVQWLRREIRPWYAADGSIGGIVIFSENVTDKKLAESALRNREERLRGILKAASDAIITIDERGLIVDVNPAAETMFGYSQDELFGKNVKLLMPPPYCDSHDDYIRRYLETGKAGIIGTGREVAGLRKDGSIFPVDLAVSQVDHLGLFTGIVRDVSERKQLQAHLLNIAAEEQRRIGQELHDGTQQELTALQLVAGTMLDLLNSVPEQSTAGQSVWRFDKLTYARLSEITMKLCQRLAESTLHVQKLARGIMPVQIDAEGLRNALADLCASTNGLKGISCRFDFSGQVSLANNTIATHLYRIAQEAVNNAVRHSGSKQIEIRLGERDGLIRLEVRDFGTGFDASEVAQMARIGEARGMGLRLMEYRAGLIGGTLRVDRIPEGGTSVKCEVFAGR